MRRILVVLLVTFISGCLKVHETPVDENIYPELKIGNNLGCFAYWPLNQNKKWVYKVSQLVGGNYVYQYDDTLEYFKDTNILKDGYLHFAQYKFKKMPSDYQFYIGAYLETTLSYYLYGVSYDAFNLNNINDSNSKIYSWNGNPFDNRFQVSYSSPFINNFTTTLGKHKVISSTIKYTHTKFGGGSISFEKQMYLAQNIGLVDHSFSYRSVNNLNVIDSSLNLKFEIIKAIN